MLESLDMVPFSKLVSLDLAKHRILIAYEHQFIPQLVLARCCPRNMVGFFSFDEIKIKFANMFRINIISDLPSALTNYDYLILDNIFYDLTPLKIGVKPYDDKNIE
jgi:hypothetical protein